MQLPAGPAGARNRSWRQGRGGLPPVATLIARQPCDLFLERPGQHDHGARAHRLVLAADRKGVDPAAPAPGILSDLESEVAPVGEWWNIVFQEVRAGSDECE